MSKTILITGASSGFGRDTAETLRHAGHAVYASMRGAQGKNREAAEALRELGVKTVELDVRGVGKTGVTRYTRLWRACSATLSGTAFGTRLAGAVRGRAKGTLPVSCRHGR